MLLLPTWSPHEKQHERRNCLLTANDSGNDEIPGSQLGPPATTLAGEGGMPHYCWLGLSEVQALHVVSLGVRRDLLSFSRDESPGFLLGTSLHPPEGESLGLLQPLLVWVGEGHKFFSGVWLDYCLKVFCLPRLLLSWSFG